jgi:retron-type reverse transcriptase
VQRYVLDGIVAHIPPHAAAHGFRTDHSIATFATPHVGRDVVIRLDLQAFFTSVFQPQIAAIFETAGYPERVARTLSALCTHRTPADVLAAPPSRAELGQDPMMLPRLRTPHLPQGAPTSGALANLAAYALDVRIAALANSLDAHYTRYADDLVISGGRDLVRAATTIIARVGAIAAEQGFALNFRKTRVMTASTRQRITGLVVNHKLAVPRIEIERLRAILHNCTRTGPAAQNRDEHADFRAHLLGRVAWVASIDPVKGARLRALFDRVDWPR